MSDFNYYYTFYDKSRGDEVLMALRQSGAETKSEAIDFLIDRGYLHSDEVYDSAVANAMGDFLGISSYNPEDDDEFSAPVGTKHSALDEVHQRLRESGKKRRQQKITKARRMKQRKFEGHHGHHHAAEMTPDIMDYPGLPVVPDSYGTNSALDSGNGVPVWYGSAESENEELERLRRIVANLPDSICRCCGDSKWTGDGIDFMCVFCEEMKECDFCNEDEMDAETFEAAAEQMGQLRYDARFERREVGDQDVVQNYDVIYSVFARGRVEDESEPSGYRYQYKEYTDFHPAFRYEFNKMIKKDIEHQLETDSDVWHDFELNLENRPYETKRPQIISGDIEYEGPEGKGTIEYEATLSPPRVQSELIRNELTDLSYHHGLDFKRHRMGQEFDRASPYYRAKAETFEAPFAGAGSLFKFGGNDSALGGFTAKELTESSAIHGDFDHAALNYSGKQNIEARAESANPTGGATGDQIVSWEHNGLSSPSGPPSDIFWAEGYGDMSRYITIDFNWDYSGEYDDEVSDNDYYITEQIKDLVESEVNSGEYSGNGLYSFTVENAPEVGAVVDIEYSWG